MELKKAFNLKFRSLESLPFSRFNNSLENRRKKNARVMKRLKTIEYATWNPPITQQRAC